MHARRANAYRITRRHGSIAGWMAAQWRDEEARETADERRAWAGAWEPYRRFRRLRPEMCARLAAAIAGGMAR